MDVTQMMLRVGTTVAETCRLAARDLIFPYPRFLRAIEDALSNLSER